MVIVTTDSKEAIAWLEVSRSLILSFLFGRSRDVGCKRGEWFTSKQISLALNDAIGHIIADKYATIYRVGYALRSLRKTPPNGAIRFQWEENTNRDSFRYRIRQPRWYEDAVEKKINSE